MGIGLCVVGCGQFARTFVKAIRSFDAWGPDGGPDLFFASRDRKRAAAYCRRFNGGGYFGSYEEAASDPRVQAMYLCTPHHLHVEHALLAARHSRHILVEKPIASTLEEGERMVVAAREADVKLMVAENFRFMPTVRKARELISEGAIGTVRLLQVQEEARYLLQGWRGDPRQMGGGVLIDGGIHSMDMLIDLAGMPREVYSASLPRVLPGSEGEDGTVLMARLERGATGFINHAWGISKRAWRLWVSVSGTRGRIYFEPRMPVLKLETEDGPRTFRFPQDRSGIGSMVKEFQDSIREDRPPLTSGEEGLRDLQVVLAAYESAARGIAVRVE